MGETVHIRMNGRAHRPSSLMIIDTLIIPSTPVMALGSGGSPGSHDVPPYNAEESTGVDVLPTHTSISGDTENLGQVHDVKVRYYATSTSGGVAMFDYGITFTLTEPPTETALGPEPPLCLSPKTSPSSILPRAPSTTIFFG